MTIKIVLPLLVALALMGGCVHTMPEPPICVPVRQLLVNLSVEDQQSILDLVGRNALSTIATNDSVLKSRVRLLEGLIEAHDSPLESCD